MMTGTLYPVTLLLQSPVHAGGLPVGNILRTRHWVSGKAMWGAATAALVEFMGWPLRSGSYLEMGKIVREHYRFGYFFPVCASWPTPYLAQETGTDLFEYRYLDTYASTAVDSSESSAAEANSLHEIEFIRHYTRPVSGVAAEPVSLAGHVFALPCTKLPLDAVLSALNGAQVGGKRGNGYGRVTARRGAATKELFGATVDDSGVATLSAGMPAAAHVTMAGPGGIEIKQGRPEPFLGREWHAETGAGQEIPLPRRCWQPGVRFRSESRLRIGDFGVWTPADQ